MTLVVTFVIWGGGGSGEWMDVERGETVTIDITY